MAKTICIDIGHYAKYNKGVVSGYYESERMWKLGEFLISELKNYDVNIITTRKDQKVDLSLSNRAAVAVKNKADLFISLHSNASGSSLSTSSSSVRGVVVFYSVNQTKLKSQANELAQVVASAMGTSVDRVATWPSTTRPGFDYLTVMDRAVQGGVPIMFLIEHGFHTNKEDCTLLMNDSVLKKIAIAEAEYFAKLLGVAKSKKETTTSTTTTTSTSTSKTTTNAAKTTKYVVNTTSSNLNVRSDPSTAKKAIGSLKKSDIVDVVSIVDGWAKIKFGSGYGYVSSKYLMKQEASKTTSASNSTSSKSKKTVSIPTSTLKKGSKGDDVKLLQNTLNSLGYSCGTADGILGSKTLSAVKKFQKANGLTVDGIVGKNTWTKLLS